ncbi:MAG TPA: hypothetical protein VGM75_04520 [Pseudonocardiaceae bacterium]
MALGGMETTAVTAPHGAAQTTSLPAAGHASSGATTTSDPAGPVPTLDSATDSGLSPAEPTSGRPGTTSAKAPVAGPGWSTPVLPTLPPTADPPTTTAPTATPTPPGGVQRGVRIGQPCAPEGAQGITVSGQAVVCWPAGPGPKGHVDAWKRA